MSAESRARSARRRAWTVLAEELAVPLADGTAASKREELEPGDGRVTKASLLARDSLAPDAAQPGCFPIANAVFICRGHAELPSDMTFRDNLLNILLY